ncbi:hypothetical protein [Micromonospora sp. CPCC 206061]|uniref:hypothetical protein n=1 Tax=Micromonospora sp. CPCC 206061 TaxID=3122410 RepID=UPI002FF3C261
MPDTHTSLPDFTRWPSFPFEGDLRVKQLDDPVEKEPSRKGEDSADCSACSAPDEAYIWVSERWRVRAMDRPTGLPMVLILESRSHLDLGDLPNLLAAELGVMTVRLERAVRSLDGVARVHVNRWGDGSAHLHMWFLARPYGRLQLRGTFLSLWDDILPPIPEAQWRENLALVAAWLAEFGGKPLAEPPRIEWHAPSTLAEAAGREEAAAAEARARDTEDLGDDVSVALVEAAPDEPVSESVHDADSPDEAEPGADASAPDTAVDSSGKAAGDSDGVADGAAAGSESGSLPPPRAAAEGPPDSAGKPSTTTAEKAAAPAVG